MSFKVYTQEEVDAILPDEYGVRHFPSGDYTAIKKFSEECVFGEGCRFGEECEFGERCSFGFGSIFGSHCSFGTIWVFGEECKFGVW